MHQDAEAMAGLPLAMVELSEQLPVTRSWYWMLENMVRGADLSAPLRKSSQTGKMSLEGTGHPTGPRKATGVVVGGPLVAQAIAFCDVPTAVTSMDPSPPPAQMEEKLPICYKAQILLHI